MDQPTASGECRSALGQELDPACVPNPNQVAQLLAAVAAGRGRGPHLEAFFGCMYYAAMRPAEVIHLQLSQCHLSKTGWGMLNLTGGVVASGKEWTDSGEVHEIHCLAPDGRLFRNEAGGYVEAAAYGKTWAAAARLCPDSGRAVFAPRKAAL